LTILSNAGSHRRFTAGFVNVPLYSISKSFPNKLSPFLVKVLYNKIEASHNESDDFSELSKFAKRYLENYDFNHIIDTYQLYSEDVMRIKNIRISILSSLEESKLISKIQYMLER